MVKRVAALLGKGAIEHLAAAHYVAMSCALPHTEALSWPGHRTHVF